MTRAEQKLVRRLRRRKYRREEGAFLVEGVRGLEDALASSVPLRFAVASPRLEDTARGRALAAGIAEACPVHRVDASTLSSLAPTRTPQGVIAVAEIPSAGLEALAIEGAATVLVLDAVQDPGNFGTLTRTAEALGVRAVVALPGTVDPWNPKAVRAAAGASFRIPIIPAEGAGLLEWLYRNGFTLYGAAAEGDAVDRVPLPQRAALVVGNEGAGLRPEMRDAAERQMAVPIRGRADSLNVAVAAGILLFFLTRGG